MNSTCPYTGKESRRFCLLSNSVKAGMSKVIQKANMQTRHKTRPSVSKGLVSPDFIAHRWCSQRIHAARREMRNICENVTDGVLVRSPRNLTKPQKYDACRNRARHERLGPAYEHNSMPTPCISPTSSPSTFVFGPLSLSTETFLFQTALKNRSRSIAVIFSPHDERTCWANLFIFMEVLMRINALEIRNNVGKSKPPVSKEKTANLVSTHNHTYNLICCLPRFKRKAKNANLRLDCHAKLPCCSHIC